MIVRPRSSFISTVSLALAGLLAALPFQGAMAVEPSAAQQQEYLTGLMTGKDVSVMARGLNAPVSAVRGRQRSDVVAELKGAERVLLRAVTEALKYPDTGLEQVFQQYETYQVYALLEQDRLRAVVDRAKSAGLSSSAQGLAIAAEEKFSASVSQVAKTILACKQSSTSSQCRSGLADFSGIFSVAEELKPVLRATLPVGPAAISPRALQSASTYVPAYLNGQRVAVEPDDTRSADETEVTTFVAAKAKELGYDPVKVYEYVRNTIRPEWYAGSQKSGDRVLQQGSGNDIDQASALIALYRASGIPARYVHGVINLSVDQLQRMTGASTADLGSKILAKAGVAFSPVIQGGKLAALRMESVWVEARVPYANYRGNTVDTAGAVWVPLMPFIKDMRQKGMADLLASSGIAPNALVADYLKTVREQTLLELVKSRIESYANKAGIGSLSEIMPANEVIAQSLQVIPNSSPATQYQIWGEYASLPDSFRTYVKWQIRSGETDNDAVVLEYRTALSKLDGKRVTLSYIPASQEDLLITRKAGGLDFVPIYMIKLRAQLKIDGEVVAYGKEALNPGLNNRVDVVFAGMNGTSPAITHKVVAGSTSAIGIAAQSAKVQESQESPADTDTKAGKLLHRVAQQYLADWMKSEDELGALMGVMPVRVWPAVVFVDNRYRVEQLDGFVHGMEWVGVSMDAAFHPVDALALNEKAQSKLWLQLAALEGSSLENIEFSRLFLVDSISADKGLALALQQQNPILELNAATWAQHVSELKHSQQVVDEVASWIAQGATVTIPTWEIYRNDWQGSVWKVDATSGASGYFIAGGLAGGEVAVRGEGWILSWLENALRNAGEGEANSDPLSVAVIQKVGDWNIATVGREMDQRLTVVVRDREGAPVQGAQVTFTASLGGGTLEGGNTSVTTQSDESGRASVSFTPGTDTTLSPFFERIDSSDEFPSRMGLNQIDVSAPSLNGLVTAMPFNVLGKPDVPAKLQRTSGEYETAVRLQVQDRYGNSIANQSITATSTTGTSACSEGVDVQDAAKFVSGSGAGTVSCLLTPGFSCASSTLTVKTSATGVLINVIPGNYIRGTYPTTFTSGQLSTELTVYNPEGTCPVRDGTNIKNELYVRSVAYVNEHGAIVAAAGLSQRIPVPFESRLVLVRSKTVSGCQSPDVEEVAPDSASDVVYEATSGFADEYSYAENNTVIKAYVTTPPLPLMGLLRLNVRGEIVYKGWKDAGSCSWSLQTLRTGAMKFALPFNAFFSVKPTVVGFTGPGVNAQGNIELTSAGIIKAPVEMIYNIEPATFEGLAAYGEYLESGSPFQTLGGNGIRGTGTAVLPRDKKYEMGVFYQAKAGVTAAADKYIQSDPKAIPLDVPLFADFSSNAFIWTDVDLANNFGCRGGGSVGFTLNDTAKVKIYFIQENSTQRQYLVGSDSEAVELSAGAHEYPVEPGSLLPARYKVYVEGVRTRDGHMETRDGPAGSERITHNNLPLGHALIKGVDLFMGSFTLGSTDAELPGHLPLSFNRQYSSVAGNLPGIMGIGWSHNFDSSLQIDRCGAVNVSAGGAGSMRFMPQDDGSLKPLKGYNGKLIADASADAFDFYSKDGTRYHYKNYHWHQADPQWNLEYMVDRNGNSQEYSYEVSPGRYPRVVQVRDGDGRVMSLTYTKRYVPVVRGAGVEVPLLTHVTMSGGISLDYEYDDYGRLVKALRSPAQGEARVEQYEYPADPQNRPLLAANTLQAAINPNGVRTEYTLTPDIIRVVFNSGATGFEYEGPIHRVTKVSTPAAAPIQIEYLSQMPCDVCVARVTEGQNVKTYTMNNYGAPVSIAAPEGLTTMVWDLEKVQLKTRVAPNGIRTDYEYDAYGNVTRERVGSYEQTYRYDLSRAETVPYIKTLLIQKTDRNGGVSSYQYSSSGNLLSERDPSGNTISHNYASKGDRIGTQDANGGYTRFEYNGWGILNSVRDALGQEKRIDINELGLPASVRGPGEIDVAYAYDGFGRLISESYRGTGGGQKTYTYDAVGNKLSETDENGHRTEYVYDEQGRMTSVTRADGATKRMEYSPEGNKKTETDWNGVTTTFDYNAANQLVAKNEAGVRQTRYQVDAVGNVTQETDAEGKATVYTYDALNRVTSRQSPAAGTIRYTYDGENKVKETDALGRETEFVYDASHRMTSKRLPQNGSNNREYHYSYDNNGNLLSEEDPLGRMKRYRYDLLNRRTHSEDAMRGIWMYDYTTEGYLKSETDPLGNVARYTYDVRGRKLSYTDAAGAVTRYEYDAVGNLMAETPPAHGNNMQNRIWHEYDSVDRQVATGDVRGDLNRMTLDANGNVLKSKDANGNVTQMEYTVLNQLKRKREPGGHEVNYIYRPAGKLESETTDRGAATTYEYDDAYRVSRKTDPAGVVSFTYDLAGNVLTETDRRGNTTTRVHDSWNRVVRQSDPIGALAYEFDAVGNRLSETDRKGNKTRNTYDANDRLQTVQRDGVQLWTYAYDKLGRKLSEKDANGNTVVYGYDAVGRLIKESRPEASTTNYVYNAAGDRIRTILPEGEVLRNEYDFRGRLTYAYNAIGNSTFFEYDNAGNKISERKPNGNIWLYQYDERNRLKAVADPLGGLTRYEYDTADNLLGVTDPLGHQVHYTYDLANRRTSMTRED